MSVQAEHSSHPATERTSVFTVTYHLTLMDFFALGLRTPSALIGGLYPPFMLYYAIDIFRRHPDWAFENKVINIIIAAVVIFNVLAVIAIVWAWLLAQAFRKGVNRPFTLTIIDEGLLDVGGDGREVFAWSSIRRIQTLAGAYGLAPLWGGTPWGLLIWVDKRRVIFLFARVFPSKSHARTFFAEVKSRWRIGRDIGRS